MRGEEASVNENNNLTLGGAFGLAGVRFA